MTTSKTADALFGQRRWAAFDQTRHFAAWCLVGASSALGALAVQLTPRIPPAPRRVSLLEFHAEAGAPEGALYVDGEWVGSLPGITRL